MHVTSSPPLVHRLRGLVRDAERSFDLAAGRHLVGSARQSDVVLPVPGVSRRHAVIEVTADGLWVEDQGSKNGTFVDELRIDRAPVAAGAVLRFGPVRLRVETLEPEDTELAIVLGPAGGSEEEPPSSRLGEETTQLHPEDAASVPALWVRLLGGFGVRLPEGLREALSFLAGELEVAGCCAVDWPRGEDPLVLASAGRLHELPPADRVRELAGGPSEEVRVALVETDPPTSLALRAGLGQRGQPSDPRGLVLWGEFAGRRHSTELLRALLRLVDGFHRGQGALPGEAPSQVCGLRFPAGYCVLGSPPMAALYQQLGRLLQGTLPLLILGETGVGKERLARILHASGERRHGPFVAVNCAAIPAQLLEAEMFGIAKGVATGVEPRPGKFQLAEGGILFLDEIGEMAPELQTKLLRALQDKEVHPVGGRPRAIDVRVVSATNADLSERIEAGAFRRDVYYRLAGYVLKVPPLGQCRDDVPALVEHFLELYSRDTGTRVRGLTLKALRLLSSYPWPGNVRELEHEVRRLVYQSHHGQVIDSTQLSDEIVRGAGAGPSIPAGALALGPRLRELEGQLIREALRRSSGNRSAAARLLGISRQGLANKMTRLEATSRR